jgi:hypothetical protein
MLFYPPVIPPISLGRFKKKDLQSIIARCGEPNHPFVGITRRSESDGHVPNFLWFRDENRTLVCSKNPPEGH